jgi:hypothetical protein
VVWRVAVVCHVRGPERPQKRVRPERLRAGGSLTLLVTVASSNGWNTSFDTLVVQ